MFLPLFLALAATATSQTLPQGTVQSAYDMLERVLPGSSTHFALTFVPSCPGATSAHCFTLSDAAGGKVAIAGTSASQLTAAIGVYFRDWCNMTFGWVRGGGSNIFTPPSWPPIGAPTTVSRAVPYNYIMNVCTHSYSLWTHTWESWEGLIDWMALSGINLFLAMTGQEEVQYKVFSSFGLNDTEIRQWFNGPALLTWSRGQNEYGNDIAGPLPRSFMKAQWDLQRLILARTRPLGMSGQLPAFQGNVPAALKALRADSNMTIQGDTAWMDSLDPLYGEIADAWMKQMIADFGTDHWWQLDGYFDGGTAPWASLSATAAAARPPTSRVASHAPRHPPTITTLPLTAPLPPCTWSPITPDTYLADCPSSGCKDFPTLAAAQAACAADVTCGGLTAPAKGGVWELRASTSPEASPVGESSIYILNAAQCRPGVAPDPAWVARGAAAYAGIARSDPEGIWSFQGWAIISWDSAAQAASFGGFVAAVPRGKFVVIDMSTDGTGEWQKWGRSAFFGAPFIWTTLHDFGGTLGLKGDLARVNRIPFDAQPPAALNASVWGSGVTPEGIDQNPVYYEVIGSAPFRTQPLTDIPGHVVLRSHRRYGLAAPNPDVTSAWALLVNSSYSQDLSVQDDTGVPHLPGGDAATFWQADRYTPRPGLCQTYTAWKALRAAAAAVDTSLEPFRYDLVNLGRELLARLSTPMSLNFTQAAFARGALNASAIAATGGLYVGLLGDLDTLLATDPAFALGPIIAAARTWGANATDCAVAFDPGFACPDFMEWNARVQITTWNPVPPGATAIPGGPIDYASKHWSGLISGYYQSRAAMAMRMAGAAAQAGLPWDGQAWELAKATHATEFQLSTAPLPTEAVGDYLQVTDAMMAKYGQVWFEPYC